MNKASGGDGIPVELFEILKDDAVKVVCSICQQIWNALLRLNHIFTHRLLRLALGGGAAGVFVHAASVAPKSLGDVFGRLVEGLVRIHPLPFAPHRKPTARMQVDVAGEVPPGTALGILAKGDPRLERVVEILRRDRAQAILDMGAQSIAGGDLLAGDSDVHVGHFP